MDTAKRVVPPYTVCLHIWVAIKTKLIGRGRFSVSIDGLFIGKMLFRKRNFRSAMIAFCAIEEKYKFDTSLFASGAVFHV